MADFESLYKSLKGMKSGLDDVYNNGKLEKACIAVLKKPGDTDLVMMIPVQFNPAEYSISRSLKLANKTAVGGDADTTDIQAVCGENSVLKVSLYFDSYTEWKSQEGIVNKTITGFSDILKGEYNQAKADYLPSFDNNEEFSPSPDVRVNVVCECILQLIKYKHDEHAPPIVAFVWGDHLQFEGIIAAHTANYTMFDRSGTPLRAKIDLTIVGEEQDLIIEKANRPFESPDRTKQRTLGYGDQLWMLAQEEYGDPARWKTIAAANNLLNPRAVTGAVRLKVPSIR